MRPKRHMGGWRWVALVFCLLAGSVITVRPAWTTPKVPQTRLRHARLTIVTATGRHVFRVAIAATPASRERGLMFRRHLGPDEGMLFDLGPGQHRVIMWMKDTLIPLDMIFIARNGIVRSIAANTVPLSHKLIPSQGPVKAVLEVAAGTAARLHIKVGDRVLNSMFKDRK